MVPLVKEKAKQSSGFITIVSLFTFFKAFPWFTKPQKSRYLRLCFSISSLDYSSNGSKDTIFYSFPISSSLRRIFKVALLTKIVVMRVWLRQKVRFSMPRVS